MKRKTPIRFGLDKTKRDPGQHLVLRRHPDFCAAADKNIVPQHARLADILEKLGYSRIGKAGEHGALFR